MPLQGGKTKDDNATKYKTNVGYYKAPLFHFEYRLVILLHPYCSKANDAMHGMKYREHLVESGVLDKSNFYKRISLSNVCGNRDLVFYVRAAAPASPYARKGPSPRFVCLTPPRCACPLPPPPPRAVQRSRDRARACQH